MASTQTYLTTCPKRSDSRSCATSSSSAAHRRETCDFDMDPTPSCLATRSTLAVDMPFAYISTTHATRALSARCQCSTTPSG